jgi:hypothetical protein
VTDHQIILACIRHCQSRRDERGRWRAMHKCSEELWWADGETDSLTVGALGYSVMAAAAARRIGAWLATVQLPTR